VAPAEDRSKTWSDWYRLARGTLGYRHEEAVEYANHRFVEEQNRKRIPRRTLRRA
jgi:hypothetical protein